MTTQQEAAFPLTLALSLREREWRSTIWDYPLNAGHFRALPRAHPLPEGEGRGEGEQGARLLTADALAVVASAAKQLTFAELQPSYPSTA